MSPNSKSIHAMPLVDALRHALPYINAHRGRTFVVGLSGATVQDTAFTHLIHDLALLGSLGVRLVLVHGARSQIESQLQARGLTTRYAHGLRVTDDTTLACVIEAIGQVRIRIEALLSSGLANSPMAGSRVRVVSGNFITAQPLGIQHGVDYQHTGTVRRVDREAICRHLDAQEIVLVSPLGYSPTGEVFNLSAEAVATAIAVDLTSDKLIFLVENAGILDRQGALIPQITLEEAEEWLFHSVVQPPVAQSPIDLLAAHVTAAINALKKGVGRVHLVSRHTDGALLLELFTRDGHGTLIDRGHYEGLRPATIEDVGGILVLIDPLEKQGILVRRSREKIEAEIHHYVVSERDGTIVGCAALYVFTTEQIGELACLAVHSDYRRQKRGDALLTYLERRAQEQALNRLFVLTTHTTHWFLERGFKIGTLEDLPLSRQTLYNWQRGSKVLIKYLL